MQKVLIIAENSLQQTRLCTALDLDRTVQYMTANLRQISPKNLRSFQQSDLIVLEDNSEQDDPRTTDYLLSSLKTTGLPIVLLPPSGSGLSGKKAEPLVLNLTEASVAKPGLAALINKIREQYIASTQVSQEEIQAQDWPSAKHPIEAELSAENMQPSPLLQNDSQLVDSASLSANAAQSPSHPTVSMKVMYALTAMGRISKQLRGPLSNMNLAIHMLGQVQSIGERDRYVKLLREEYHRELQLLNELENLHDSLERIL